MRLFIILIIFVLEGTIQLSFANEQNEQRASIFEFTTFEPQLYDCKKKYCKDMESCEEACYKFKVCGQKKLDSDDDNIPCENVCSSPCP